MSRKFVMNVLMSTLMPGQDVERVFRNLDGVVAVLAPEAIRRDYGADEFLLHVNGTSYDDLVEKVHELGIDSASNSAFDSRSWDQTDHSNKWAAC